MSSDDRVVAKALAILARRMAQPHTYIANSNSVKQFLALKLAKEQRELFAVLWLNASNGLIRYDEIGLETVGASHVYPREVVKAALSTKAASAVLVHHHPSGDSQPSSAELAISMRLKRLFELIEVQLLDHIIVAGLTSTSLAEQGLL